MEKNMAINRIFYASQVAFATPWPLVADDGANYTEPLYGIQSIGINTNFNLEQSFELGQLEIYDNAEGVAEVEVTIERVLDGFVPLYSILTRNSASEYYQEFKVEEARSKLLNRSTKRTNLTLGIYDDNVNPTGNPDYMLYMSGMYINNISYNFPSDGPFTESVTLVGNFKEWGGTEKGSKYPGGEVTVPINLSNGLSLTYLNSGVMRRQNLVKNDDRNTSYFNSVLPIDEGIQSISISVDLGREDLLELGSKGPFYRAPNFPVEVTCDIEVLTKTGDLVDIEESAVTNLTNEQIRIALAYDPAHEIVPQYTFDLGDQNKLSSITYGGGDAGGGNATVTFSYTNFNYFTTPAFINSAYRYNYLRPPLYATQAPGRALN